MMLKVHTLMGLVDDEDSQEAGNILRTIRGAENATPGHKTTIAEYQTILSGRLDQMMGGAPAMTTAGHDERMEKQREYSMNQVWKKTFFLKKLDTKTTKGKKKRKNNYKNTHHRKEC